MADAIQRDGAAKQRSRAGMWGSDGEPGRPMSCRRSLQKTADDGFAIWRTPYSETELQSSGVELACGDRTESRERPMSCRRSQQKTADDGFTIWRTPYSE